MKTEAFIGGTQEQDIANASYLKYNIDKTADSLLCRMCSEKGENGNHIFSESKVSDQKEYSVTCSVGGIKKKEKKKN